MVTLNDLRPLEYGASQIIRSSSGAQLSIGNGMGYSNAQLDDYARSPRRMLPWRPPVRMRLRARANLSNPVGTAGFGFWNDPFSIAFGQPGAPLKLPAAPQAVWFFYTSEHSQLGFSDNVPGHGWKAMSLTTPAVPPLLLAPAALAGLALSRIPVVRKPVMRFALGRVRCDETVLDAGLDNWATYEILWREKQVEFRVDDELVLTGDHPPQGPLGFVAWIDNQYALASPDAGLRFGVIQPESEQKLEIEDLTVTRSTRQPASG